MHHDPIVPSGGATANTVQVYGIVGIGQLLVGLDSEHIREAAPETPEIEQLPIDHPGLLGAMTLREETIPVVDLSVLLGGPPSAGIGDGVIVVMRHEGRLLGLRADGLRGMVAVTRERKRRICSTDGSEVGISDAVAAHEGRLVSLVNTERLFARPGLAVATEQDQQAIGAVVSRGEPYLLCGYADFRFAFPALEIAATMPMTALEDSPVATGYCDGVVAHHGREVAMLDTLQVFGLSQNFCRPERTAGVILRMEDDNVIGFEIDHFYDLKRLRRDALAPLPKVLTTRADLFVGVQIDRGEQPFLVVDTASLRADGDLADYARALPSSAEIGEASTHIGPLEQFLVFDSVMRFASPLLDIREILRCPDHLLYADANATGMVGSLTHRGQVVPVFCLARMLGEFAFFDEEFARILLSESGDRLYGFLVERVTAVERAWRMPRSGIDAIGDVGPFGASDIIKLRRNGDLIEVFDMPRFLADNG